MILSAGLGLLLDVIIWRPLRRKRVGVVQLMIVSIGLSLTLRYIFQFFIGGGTTQLPFSSTEKLPLFGVVTMSIVDMVSFAICIVVIVAFALWLTYSRTGKATRAIADNSSLAAASGIDVDAVVRVVWVIAGTLAGLSGILYAYFRPGLKWDMGAQVLLLMFAAVTLGGLGTAFGAWSDRSSSDCSWRSRPSGSRRTSSTQVPSWSSSSSCCSARRASSAAAKE